jgi:hypothetical protein
MQTIEVQYRPGDLVHVVKWNVRAGVHAILVDNAAQPSYLVTTTGPLGATGWFTADQLEPLIVNGKEIAP